MALIRFPDPRSAPFGDIVTIGGVLNVSNLLRAYRQGIFPWPIEGWPLAWFCPEDRAILEFKDLHIPRRLARERKNCGLEFTIDKNFEGVIKACATAKRKDENGTWIIPGIIGAYTQLHKAGHAHSAEAWEGDRLVGGLYGVDAGGAFAGESMFFKRPNASKLAFLYLVDHLAERGVDWIDIQVMTPHMQALGAKVIDRDEFLEKLAGARERGLQLF
jgi:leucyl/phenylalanyl-tRNA--protein transferase